MYKLRMGKSELYMSRNEVLAIIAIPRDMLRKLVNLAVGATITISGWEITRI